MIRIVESDFDFNFYKFRDEDKSIVDIADGVEKIRSNVFSYKDNIKEVNLPNSVKVIEFYAFAGCENLEKINIPNSVEDIGLGAFVNCHKLKSIKLPNSLKKINSQAFYKCDGLKKVILPNNAMLYDSIFENCVSLEDVVIPNGTRSIPYCMFRGCTSLNNVVIPETVTHIGSYAFGDCKSLTNIKILGNPDIDEYSFDGVLSIEQAYELVGKKILTPYNIQKYKRELLDIVSEYMDSNSNSNSTRCYILPNGDFLPNMEISGLKGAKAPHRVSDGKLKDILIDKLGWIVKDFDLTGKLGESIFDMLGCVRVNGEKENYIALPKDKITTAQQYSLEEWLDYYFYTLGKGIIKVVTYNGREQITYNQKEYEPKEIVQKINRFYNTGNLYENKIIRKRNYYDY